MFIKKLGVITILGGVIMIFGIGLFGGNRLGQAAGASGANPFSTLASGGAGGWVNVTRPLTEADMKGRLVLLDFWTYGCVNCMQIVPDLKYLEQTFGDNLLIIGVHSAKFRGEQGNDRILSAAKRFGLEHPVINDSDFAIWKNFGVRAWPTLILLGPNGQEISRYEGEGHREDLKADISKNRGAAVKIETPVASLVAKERGSSVLSFPARVKKYGDLIYVADSGHDRIVVMDKAGKMVASYDGFHHPRGFDVAGHMLYVADTDHHSLVAVDMTTGVREILGGDGTRGRIWASPWDVGVMPDHSLVIAMAGTHQIYRFDPERRTMSVVAGNGREGIVDDVAEDSELAQPSALSLDTAGHIYFVDAESSALRVIKDGRVQTLIGTGLFDFGRADGVYPVAQMQHPQGLSVKGDQVYISDTYNNAIRIYDIPTGRLSTLSATGETLDEPGAVWVEDDQMLIADTNHNRILVLDLKLNQVSEWPGSK